MAGLPGSASDDDFERVVSLLELLVDRIDNEALASIYTTTPLLSQLLGLEQPLFGTGDSPFSLVRYVRELESMPELSWAAGLSILQRRELVDEITDLSCPILLGDDEAYVEWIEGLVSDLGLPPRRATLERRMARLAPLVKRLTHADAGFAVHVAHYGQLEDLRREHEVLDQLDAAGQNRWFVGSLPTIFELNFRGVESGLRRLWVVVIGNSTRQLLDDRELRQRKVRQAFTLAERLGAKRVGMGGLVASFASGGSGLQRSFPELDLTTGHAYTIANLLEIARDAATRSRLAWDRATVGVVGAGGSIGSGVARMLAELGPRQLILFDVPGHPELARVAREVHRAWPRVRVQCAFELSALRAVDLAIVATNFPGSLIDSSHVAPGALIIDDSFPKNFTVGAAAHAGAVALEGGLVRLPASLEIDRARNMPNLLDVPMTRMISCREVYGCFAETMTLAMDGHEGPYGLGPADPALAQDILRRARALGFEAAPLQHNGAGVHTSRLETAALQRASEKSRA